MTTSLDEIADGIYRISTAVDALPGGFTFNQFLIADDEPLLFHTGMRSMFPALRDAIARVLPLERLRWIAYSHFEPDECGAMNALLAVAPRATPVCSRVAAMIGSDAADRAPRALADGERLPLGRRVVEWHDAPHVPHGWDCGFLAETTTRTLFCGDLFTQAGGAGLPPITEGDILGPSEAMRAGLDYFAHGANTRAVLERLARTKPATLACMHGSAWRGDGEQLLLALAARLGA